MNNSRIQLNVGSLPKQKGGDLTIDRFDAPRRYIDNTLECIEELQQKVNHYYSNLI